jgi:hypothetical protein
MNRPRGLPKRFSLMEASRVKEEFLHIRNTRYSIFNEIKESLENLNILEINSDKIKAIIKDDDFMNFINQRKS